MIEVVSLKIYLTAEFFNFEIDEPKETLGTMCTLKVVKKCKQPNEWQSNIIFIEKPSIK